MKYYLTIVVMLSCFWAKAQQHVTIDTISKPYSILPHYYSGDKSLIIEDFTLQDTSTFRLQQVDQPRSGVHYWSIILLDIPDRLGLNYLEFGFPMADRLLVHVPLRDGGYQQHILGMSNPRGKVSNMDDVSRLLIETEEVDLKRPFFVKNICISIFGINSFSRTTYLTGYDKKPKVLNEMYQKRQLMQSDGDFKSHLLFGMTFISFVFMLTFFVIHRKIYFLYYALYLVSLMVIYASWTAYFYNGFSSLHDFMYLYLSLDGQIFSNLFYMLFLQQFVGMKRHYPLANKIYGPFIGLFVIFHIVYNIIVLTNPYYPDLDTLSHTAVYSVSAMNFLIVTYMFIKKRLIHTTIVFAGSILLLVGLVLTTVFSDKFIVVYTIVLETVLFMGVISYLDLKNLRKALESDKLKQINDFKNRFFTNISHEFRTPLTLISVPIQEKLEDETLSEKDRNNFEMIQRNNERLLSLVEQLLDLSKIESGNTVLQVKQGDVLYLLRGLADAFTLMASQKHLNYNIEIGSEVENVWFDKDVLEKVVVNLLSNAVKYTPQKGSVICKAWVSKDLLTLVISNTGKGLSQQQMSQIFDRFYQVDENQLGAGVGLALVKELVSLHKGTIGVTSETEGHTVFSVELPVGKKSFKEYEVSETEMQLPVPVVASVPDNVEGSSAEKRPLLLLVEDNADMLMMVSKTLESQYAIIHAQNGQEGLVLAQENIPDIIVSDVMMPVKDGISLTRDLKSDEKTCHIPVILLTAKAGEYHEVEGIETGANDYITKPFNSKLLRAKVASLIEIMNRQRARYSKEYVLQPQDIAVTSIDEQFLVKVKDILDQQLVNTDFNSEAFSKAVGMSRMQLHRKLKALTGLSASEFLRSQRLILASNLLKKAEVRISDVGYAVGFNNLSYFAKCFRETYDCTPSEYAQKFENTYRMN